MPYLAIRLRGSVKRSHEVEETMQKLGLKHANSMAVLPETAAMRGMLRKVDNFITYGVISAEDAKPLKKRLGLTAPRGGLKSVKQRYPRGDMGYRGEAIKKLLERM